MSRYPGHYQRTASRGEQDVSEAVRRRVCEKLQSELTKSKNFVEDGGLLLEEAKRTQEELRNKATAAEESFFEGKSRLVADGERTLRVMEDIISESSKKLDSLKPMLADDEDGLDEAKKIHDRIKETDKKLEYLRRLELIDDLCDRIRSSLACDAVDDAIDSLQNLINGCDELRATRAEHLLQYMFRVTVHWNRLICDKVAQGLPTIFTRIGYPRPPSVQKSLAVTVDARSRSEVAQIVNILIKLRLPDYITNGPSQNTRQLIALETPMSYFILPLEKRFRFHFYVSEKTSRPEKPEWYFTQILSWIKDYADFIGDLLQPVYRSGDVGSSAKVEFVHGLVGLCQAKLLSSVPVLLQDKTLFAHAVDEILSFCRMLSSMGFESIRRAFSTVLLIPEVFDPWLTAEIALGEERMDIFFSSPNAWKCQFVEDSSSPEELKVPECAEQYVIMLKGITERYGNLPSMDHQLNFFGVQLASLEEFVSLMKSAYEENENDVKYCVTQLGPSLATTAKFLYQYLMDFSNTTLTIQLLSPSLHSPPSSSSHLSENFSQRFTAVLEEIDRLSKISLPKRMLEGTVSIVRNQIREYGRQGWKTVPSVTEYLVATLSPALGELTYTLKTILSAQKDRLFTSLFIKYISDLMRNLDDLLFSEVITKNSFSTGGAAQLKYDIINNMIVILQRTTGLPNAGLTRTVEGCMVLCMVRGTAMLLAELFESGAKNPDTLDTENITKTLTEMNVVYLKLDEVHMVLKKRSDLEIN